MIPPRSIMTCYASLNRCPPEAGGSLDWLGAQEYREYARLRDANRRRQWLAGRWLAKQLMRHVAGMSELADWQILSRNDQGQGVRPRVVRGRRELDCTLSISHSDRGVLVALAPDSGISVGVDLAAAVPTSTAFRRLWFAPSEQRWLAHDPQRRTRVLWAIKEATYKAAHAGESWNPREIEVMPGGVGRFECVYRGQPLCRLVLNVHEIDNQIAVVACLPRATFRTSRSPMSTLGGRSRALAVLNLFRESP